MTIRMTNCLLVSAMLTTTVCAQSDYLIKDSFEKGGAEPNGWSRGAEVAGVKYVYDKKIASHGERSLSLQKSAQKYFPIAAWNRTVRHHGDATALKISTKVKAVKATKAILDVQFLDDSGEWIKHEWAIYIGQKNNGDPVATHDWKKYTGQLDIPDGTKEIGVSLQIYGPGKVWFDELLVSYSEESDNDGGNSDGDDSDGKKSSAGATDSKQAGKKPRIVRATTPDDGVANYILSPPSVDTEPANGYPLVLIMPGGDGSADFHGFVGAIHQHALGGKCIVAQPIAPPQIVWPTDWSRQRFPKTEESLTAIIEDVASQQPVDRSKVFALAWSSSGPAVYASLLQDDSPLAGAFIAMSVFKPDQLPPLAGAAGKRVYLYHSPNDAICPYRMAQDAEKRLRESGVEVSLADYEGGHGWHGPVHDNIRKGFDWLLSS